MSTAGTVQRLRRPDGIEIPYRVLGPGTGPRAIFAHALTGPGLDTDRRVLAPLLDRGWTVATLDQRGHGAASATTDPDDYRVEKLGEDLLAVADDLAWPSVWMVGASMGAAPAVCAAVAQPSRLEGLILLAPAFGDARNPAADMFAEAARAFRTQGMEAGCRAWASGMAARDIPDAVVEQQLIQLRVQDAAAMGVWLEEITAWTIPDQLRQLQGFPNPLAVVVWEGDDIHPADLGRRIAAAAVHGRCVTLDLGAPDLGPGSLLDAALSALGEPGPA